MNDKIREKLKRIYDVFYNHDTQTGLRLLVQLIDEKDGGTIRIDIDEYAALKAYKDHHIQSIESAQWIRDFSDELGLVATDDLCIEGVARLERQYRMLWHAMDRMGKPKPELEVPDMHNEYPEVNTGGIMLKPELKAPDKTIPLLKELVGVLVKILNFPQVRDTLSQTELEGLDELNEKIKAI